MAGRLTTHTAMGVSEALPLLLMRCGARMYVRLASFSFPSLRRDEVPRRGGDHPATAAFCERRIPAGDSGAPAVGRALNVVEPFPS
jgi:hypothetical protein